MFVGTKYTIEYDDYVWIISFEDKLSRADMEYIIDGLASGEQPTHRLWDLSNGIHYNNEDIRAIAEYAKIKLTTPAKIAVVAPSSLAFGATRIHMVHRVNEATDQQVFRDRESALEWLKQSD